MTPSTGEQMAERLCEDGWAKIQHPDPTTAWTVLKHHARDCPVCEGVILDYYKEIGVPLEVV